MLALCVTNSGTSEPARAHGSAALAFGGAFHRAAEHHYRELLEGRPAPALDALMAAYNDAWAEHDGKAVQFGKDDDRGTLDDLAGRMLAAFQASDVANPPGTIIGIEEELTGELVPGVPDLLARVDLLVDAGDSLVITDLKTAQEPMEHEQVRESAGQLLLYHELAKPMADGRPMSLQFAVATKLKNPEVHLYEVEPTRSRSKGRSGSSSASGRASSGRSSTRRHRRCSARRARYREECR